MPAQENKNGHENLPGGILHILDPPTPKWRVLHAEACEDHICKVGALTHWPFERQRLLHGYAKDSMRLYEIKDEQSEPKHQHQNPIERGAQNVKRHVNNIIDQTGWIISLIRMGRFL